LVQRPSYWRGELEFQPYLCKYRIPRPRYHACPAFDDDNAACSTADACSDDVIHDDDASGTKADAGSDRLRCRCREHEYLPGRLNADKQSRAVYRCL
jgi:hypothetical protein